MQIKKCTIPQRVLLDLALVRRLPAFHPKRKMVEEDYSNRMAGYRGEKSLDYFLNKLPGPKYDILHDVRLPSTNGKDYFQIDILLLSKHMAWIFEVKNLSGKLYFKKELDQFIRIVPGTNKEERLQNPIIQAREQAKQLKHWMHRHHLSSLPIEYFFVNSNNKTIISTDPGNEQVLERVCNSETLLDKIHQTEALNQQNKIDNTSLIKTLLNDHTPPNINIQKMYKITADEILTGVHCPQCFSLPMHYKHGKWHCTRCHLQSKTAHKETLNDYFLLIKPTITNSELRHFLHISSPNVAVDLLHSLNLPYTGTNKGRLYYMPK